MERITEAPAFGPAINELVYSYTLQFTGGLLVGMLIMFVLGAAAIFCAFFRFPSRRSTTAMARGGAGNGGVGLFCEKRKGKTSTNVALDGARRKFSSIQFRSRRRRAAMSYNQFRNLYYNRAQLCIAENNSTTQSAETTFWLSWIISNMMSYYRNDGTVVQIMAQAISSSLNTLRPSHLAPITITHFSLGNNLSTPVITAVRVVPPSNPEHIFPTPNQAERVLNTLRGLGKEAERHQTTRETPSWFHNWTFSGAAENSNGKQGALKESEWKVEVDLHLVTTTPTDAGNDQPTTSSDDQDGTEESDGEGFIESQTSHATFGIKTKLLVNFPTPRFAELPLQLLIEAMEFSGTLIISFVPPHLNFSLAPGYNLKLRISSLIGARTKLRDVPRIAQFIVSRLNAAMRRWVVDPKTLVIKVPSGADFKYLLDGHEENNSEHNGSPHRSGNPRVPSDGAGGVGEPLFISGFGCTVDRHSLARSPSLQQQPSVFLPPPEKRGTLPQANSPQRYPNPPPGSMNMEESARSQVMTGALKELGPPLSATTSPRHQGHQEARPLLPLGLRSPTGSQSSGPGPTAMPGIPSAHALHRLSSFRHRVTHYSHGLSPSLLESEGQRQASEDAVD